LKELTAANAEIKRLKDKYVQRGLILQDLEAELAKARGE
jgi:hypothetical protein